MKGLIVEIEGKNAVVLNKDGCFKKIKINNIQYNVGDEIDFIDTSKEYWEGQRKLLVAVASFVLIFGLTFCGYTYFTPYSYINVDINPSVEIVANRFDKILRIEGVNNDGEKFLENLRYKYISIDSAVDLIIDKAVSNGYVNYGESNAVILTVSSKNNLKADNLQSEVRIIAQEDINILNVQVEKVSLEEHNNARSMGISPGKLKLIEKLKETDSTVIVEEYKDTSIKKIIEDLQDNEERIGEIVKEDDSKIDITGEKKKQKDEDVHKKAEPEVFKSKNETNENNPKIDNSNEAEENDNIERPKNQDVSDKEREKEKKSYEKHDDDKEDLVEKDIKKELDTDRDDDYEKKDNITKKEKRKKNDRNEEEDDED